MLSVERGSNSSPGYGATVAAIAGAEVLYSISIMPHLAAGGGPRQPLTYEVEIMRRLLPGVGPNRLVVDFVVLLAGSVVAVAAATCLYPRRVI